MRALFASTTLGTALVHTDAGPRYGLILPPDADTPADHLRVDLAGVAHTVAAPLSAFGTHERLPIGVVGGRSNAAGLSGEELHRREHGHNQQSNEVRHGS